LGAFVPIYRLLEREGLQSDLAATVSAVFEDVLQLLGLVNREDPVTHLVAQKMIQLARAGERDPDRLKQLRLEAFEGTAI
jgi:hypothetical protein